MDSILPRSSNVSDVGEYSEKTAQGPSLARQIKGANFALVFESGGDVFQKLVQSIR